jgi:hypothetical protein
MVVLYASPAVRCKAIGTIVIQGRFKGWVTLCIIASCDFIIQSVTGDGNAGKQCAIDATCGLVCKQCKQSLLKQSLFSLSFFAVVFFQCLSVALKLGQQSLCNTSHAMAQWLRA